MNFTIGVAVLIVSLLSPFSVAQQSERKSSTLRGTVEQVNTSAKRLSVASEPVPGGMGAMTMNYAVDKEEVLGRVKPGDHITAKMYEGDMTLYDIQVLPATPVAPQSVDAPGLRLDDLERMALASNPTIAQVQANVRVSAGLARQAGLYPNPTVGYYADEVRGGYSGGGKQGGFISQTIVTGGKLRAARRVAELLTQQAERPETCSGCESLTTCAPCFTRFSPARGWWTSGKIWRNWRRMPLRLPTSLPT